VGGIAVDVTPTGVELAAAGTHDLTASVTDCGGDLDSTVTWISRNTGIATVASTGSRTATVTGVATGSVYVVADEGTAGAKDSALVTVGAATTGTTFEFADAETAGTHSPFEYITGNTCQPSPLPTTDRAKHGSRSYKFEVIPGCVGSDGAQFRGFLDTWQTGGDMDTATGCDPQEFCTGWYSWYTYVDAGYTDPQSAGNWNMLLGWMSQNPGSPGPIGHMGLEVHGGVLQVIYIQRTCMAGLYTCPQIAGYTMGSGQYVMTSSSPAGIKAFPRGQWVHLSIYYKMARTNGQVQIWQDGVKIMDLTAPTLNTHDGWHWSELKNPGDAAILQFHIYGNARPTTQRLYIDDFRVSDYRPAP
jgi:hypothetical protein